MFFGTKSRKSSAPRAQGRHRNTQGRKINVEKLQDRKLMAADFGFGGVFAPGISDIFQAAQVSTMNSNGPEALELSRTGNTISVDLEGRDFEIEGTDHRDEIEFSIDQSTGRVEFVAETFNRWGAKVGYASGNIDPDAVDEVIAHLHDGNDRFDASDIDIRVNVKGGSGDDTLIAGDYSGPSLDELWGGDGDDMLFGGGGRDYLDGGDGEDYLWGEQGNDSLFGGDDDDWLFGGSGNDFLYGNGGFDTLYGGRDNDYLDGGYDSHKDRMTGGHGNDTFIVHVGFWGVKSEDIRDLGSSGADTYRFEKHWW